MSILLLFALLFGLLIIGVPVAVSLGLASLVFILTNGMPSVIVLHNMVNGVNSFPLIAIPFFILAGHLMNTAGITTKIFN
ncbi:MAG: TRAP transporter large permease subunit, partial [Sneathiella sp.]